MNVAGNSELVENANVLPLFSTIAVEAQKEDPLEELLLEAEYDLEFIPDRPARRESILVSESHFPDQSLYILEQQLSHLSESMKRLSFYLTDLDDLLPR